MGKSLFNYAFYIGSPYGDIPQGFFLFCSFIQTNFSSELKHTFGHPGTLLMGLLSVSRISICWGEFDFSISFSSPLENELQMADGLVNRHFER